MLSTLQIPRIIGHRGAAASAPENTLASLREAARQGAAWVEVDVMLTADGVPVLFHDDTLERTTDGRGAVAATPLAALRRLDAGSWFGPGFAGERVPTLEEALDLILDLGLGLNLEVKPAPGHARETAAAAVALLVRRWPADRPAPLVSSFDPVCLEVARDIAPRLPRGCLFEAPPAGWRDLADRLGAATIHVHHAHATADVLTFGRPVLAYTVNDAATAAALFARGVTGVFTDAPGRLRIEL